MFPPPVCLSLRFCFFSTQIHDEKLEIMIFFSYILTLTYFWCFKNPSFQSLCKIDRINIILRLTNVFRSFYWLSNIERKENNNVFISSQK